MSVEIDDSDGFWKQRVQLRVTVCLYIHRERSSTLLHADWPMMSLSSDWRAASAWEENPAHSNWAAWVTGKHITDHIIIWFFLIIIVWVFF